jgi:N-acetylglutamate synthase-like GNAT family acetyltransferase
MQLKLIQHGTKEYDQMIQLRMELLRRPLGLSFSKEQLDAEKKDMLICAFENDQIIGCCVLTEHDPATIQLRQMAVNLNAQSKGIGRSIVAFAEEVAKEKGYTTLMMHARNTALDFYKKCGYEIKGDEFTEVTIPHHHMEKKLQ